MTTTHDPYRSTYHRDGSVTYGPSSRELARVDSVGQIR